MPYGEYGPLRVIHFPTAPFGTITERSNDFRSNGSHKNGNSPTPLLAFSSSDGGTSWTKTQVTSATTNSNGSAQNGFGYSGCTIRTDSHGVAYMFAERFASPASRCMMATYAVTRRRTSV